MEIDFKLMNDLFTTIYKNPKKQEECKIEPFTKKFKLEEQ